MSYTQVTLSTLLTRIGERTDASPFWVPAQKIAAINEALRVWNMLTGMWKAPVTLPTTAGTVWYSVPSTMVYDTRMEFNGRPMDPESLNGMDNGRDGWEGESTVTGSDVPTRPTLWIPAGLNLFAIWPRDAVGGNSLLLDGVRRTPVLSADADFIDIGQAELDALLGECVHILAFSEAGQRWAATQQLHKNFLIAAAEQNARLNASVFFRNAMGLDLNRYARPMERAMTPVTPQNEPAQTS